MDSESIENPNEEAPLVNDEPTCMETFISMKWVDFRVFPPLGLAMCGVYCYTFTALFVGKYLGYTTLPGIINLSVFWTLGLLYLTSYAKGAFVDPGSVPKEWKDGPTGEYALDEEPEFLLSLKEDKTYWCKKCNHYKPPRTHHCSKCKRCVLRMDHHCVWLSGCVGYYNHKFFILTTLYSLLLCWYVFFGSFLLWLCCFDALSLQEGEKLSGVNIFFLFLATFMSFFQGCGLVWLSRFQFILVVNNQTNIEHLCCNGHRPGCSWNSGSYWTNIVEVMGDQPLLWLIPVAHKFHYDVDVDGIYFEQPETDWEEEENQPEKGVSVEVNEGVGGMDGSMVVNVATETTPLL